MALETEPKLILASASPRRRDLLDSIGLGFTVQPADISEALLDNETPGEHVMRLSREKSEAVSGINPLQWVLAADTVVVLDNKILGKPESREHAISMLSTLQSRTHQVFTGYTIIRAQPEGFVKTAHVKSLVKIRTMSSREVSDYVDTGEPMDKAGAYAIQGLGAAIVEWVNGSYTNVVGLPLSEVALNLRDLGIFDFLKEASNNDR
jgi:septum formation protein